MVGHDSRYCAELFAREVARVLVANGHRVVLLDRVTPTPAVSWTITQQHAAGGVMVTASHNSAEFNGIKYKPDFGGSAPPEVVAEIERHTAEALESGVTEMTYDEAVTTGRLQTARSASRLLRAARKDGRPRRAAQRTGSACSTRPCTEPAQASSRERSTAARPRSKSCTASETPASAGCTRSRSTATCRRRCSAWRPEHSTSASPTTATPIVSASSTRPAATSTSCR